MTSLAQKTAELASHDVGEREVHTNDSPRIRQYQATVHLAPPSPYCAAAVSTWVREAATELKINHTLKFSGSALGLWNSNPELQFNDLTASDIPCIGIHEHADHVHGHAFLIVGMDESTGQLQTVDPNSNPQGGREGIGVFALNIRFVDDQELKGYLRIS